MTLKVQVAWENAGTDLLPEALADVKLTADGAPLTVTSKQLGKREFVVPDGAAQIALSAQFSVSFGAVGAEPPAQNVVWTASQTYRVIHGGTALEAVVQAAYAGAHPLVEAHVASGVNGAALLRLRTEFVDITPFWMAYADKADEYVSEHDSSLESVVALGHTGGAPLIWFASFPGACKSPPKPDISCLVFFRQTGEAYTRVDQPHQMNPLNRVLLKPVAGSPEFRKSDVFLPHEKKPGVFAPYSFIRCGFEDALQRSGKAVVMLHPWPNGLEYGAAKGADLPRLAAAAIRFLWARQRIARNLGGVQLGRLGVSGYSAGGPTFCLALLNNKDRVDEAYCFDGTSVKTFAAGIIQWFQQAPTKRCLRMSSGHQIATHAAIRASLDPGGTSARITALPGTPQGYDAGSNPLWDHTLSDLAARFPGTAKVTRADHDYWHSFALFGGFVTSPGPGVVTFLQQFLAASDF
jgi:hypothetical protein